MDFLKDLIQLNNEIVLEKIAKEKYTIEEDDDEIEMKYVEMYRKAFINNYNKVNNRQFKLTTEYKINEYYQKVNQGK